MRVPEVQEEKRKESLFKEMMTKNFSNVSGK